MIVALSAFIVALLAALVLSLIEQSRAFERGLNLGKDIGHEEGRIEAYREALEMIYDEEEADEHLYGQTAEDVEPFVRSAGGDSEP